MTAFRLVLVAVAVTALASGCAVQSGPDDEGEASSSTADASEALSSGRVDGDWSALPNGMECVGAARAWIRVKTGAALPSMGGRWSDGCAPSGACHIWTDGLLSEAEWERIPNDGTNAPELYDVIVYPPHGSNPWGHVAIVDHVENGQTYVMDDNFVGHHRRSSLPHTVGTHAYGWYRHRAETGSTPR